MISIILPTYNEADNIGVIIPSIFAVLHQKGIEAEVIVVDDNSPDATASKAEQLSDRYPVRVELRKTERGLASAVIRGFEIARGDICVVMDADLSHPVERLPDMVKPIQDGQVDATVGSRYISGGGCEGWPLVRRVISRGAGILAAGLTKLSDPTSGFMAIRKEALRGVELNPVGWKIVLEVITRTNCRFAEVPIIFRDRLHGESKLDHKIHVQYLIHLWRLYGFKLPNIMQFLNFCLVGLSGLVVDTAVLVICVEFFNVDPRYAAIVAFTVAVSWNYLLNRRWTFNYGLKFSNIQSYFAFLMVCIFGLLVRIYVMHLLITYCGMGAGRLYILASVLGILVSTITNFVGSKYLAFSRS